MEYSYLSASKLSFATPNTKLSSFNDFVNSTRNPINNLPETPNLPQADVNSKEPVIVFEKMKIENLKTEILSSLETTISFLFRKSRILTQITEVK